MKTFSKSAVTTLFLVCASAGYAAGGGQADPLCIPVDGTVTSAFAAPDENGYCAIWGVWPVVNSQPLGDPFTWLPPSMANPTCLTLTGKGKARFTGLSGITSVGVVNPFPTLPTFSATPLGFATPPGSARSDLTVFTSNAVLTGKLRNLSGNLYTQDSGVITTAGFVGQVLKIVGGTDGFAGATGEIAVAGQEVGGEAFYTGEICVKRK